MATFETPPEDEQTLGSGAGTFTVHDLTSYRYISTTKENDLTTGVEWGELDYSEGNIEHLINMFGGEASTPIKYYNIDLSGFLPAKLGSHNLTELKNNYQLDFIYNYNDLNMESLENNTPLTSLPNHYVIEQNNKITNIVMSQTGGSVIPGIDNTVLYGDDINEEAVASLSTLAGSVNSFLYDGQVETGIEAQGFNYAYSTENYYYQYYSNWEKYRESEDYSDFRYKTKICYMSFRHQSSQSPAPFYSKLRVNFAVPQFGSSLSINREKKMYSESREYIYYFYHHITAKTPMTINLNSLDRYYQRSDNNSLSVSLSDFESREVKVYGPLERPYSDYETSLMSPSEITLFDEWRFVESIFPSYLMAWAPVRKTKWYREPFFWTSYKPGLGRYIDRSNPYRPIITCFKIEKYEGTSTVPIQTFYTNYNAQPHGEYNFIELLDTQVFYNKRYRYKVSTVNRLDTPSIVIKDMFFTDSNGDLHVVYLGGTRRGIRGDTRISNDHPQMMEILAALHGGAVGLSTVQVTESVGIPQYGTNEMTTQQITEISNPTSFLEPNKIYIKTEVTQEVEFMEIEMFEDSIDTIEPIYNPPEVKFYNESGKPNDVLVQARLNYNSYSAPYIPITEEDLTSIQPYLQYFNSDGEYDFRTINGEGRFEIRRLPHPPDKYADFANGAVQEFTADNSTSAIYSIMAYAINKVKPNKKYYYILRAINAHGIYSNPTSVFQLELLQDSDDTYIIVDEYEFKNNLTNNYSKSGKRYFQIKVSNLQGLINEQTNEFENANSAAEITDVRLGPEDLKDNIWRKTFKIRLTSEKTGKKIDFNVSFKHTDKPN